MAVVPGLGPGEVGAVAPGLQVDDDRRAVGEGALEVGEVEPFAEVGGEAELAGDADDVEGMGARFGRAVEAGGETVLALLGPPVGEDGLERGRPAGVARALTDVGDGGEEGGGEGGERRRSAGEGDRGAAGSPRGRGGVMSAGRMSLDRTGREGRSRRPNPR